MKLFFPMLASVLVGAVLGSSLSWQRHQSHLLEVRVIRVVKTDAESTMRFASNSLPHTVVEHRPPVMQFALPGVAGDVGDVIYVLPPSPYRD